MDKAVKLVLSVREDFNSDLVEDIRHIDKYFSKYINANVELVHFTLDAGHEREFIVEVNGSEIENPEISSLVDLINKEVLKADCQ